MEYKFWRTAFHLNLYWTWWKLKYKSELFFLIFYKLVFLWNWVLWVCWHFCEKSKPVYRNKSLNIWILINIYWWIFGMYNVLYDEKNKVVSNAYILSSQSNMMFSKHSYSKPRFDGSFSQCSKNFILKKMIHNDIFFHFIFNYNRVIDFVALLKIVTLIEQNFHFSQLTFSSNQRRFFEDPL